MVALISLSWFTTNTYLLRKLGLQGRPGDTHKEFLISQYIRTLNLSQSSVRNETSSIGGRQAEEAAAQYSQ